MRYTDSGHWIYIAPVSRMVGAAYMSHVVSTYGIDNLATTTHVAAMQSFTTVHMALSHGFGKEIGSAPQQQLSRLAGESGALELVRLMLNCGLEVTPHVLIGAARHCDLRLLTALYSEDVLGTVLVSSRHWCEVALGLAESGDDGFALTWLSRRDDCPTAWPRYLLAAMCYRAAFRGHLATLQYLLHPRRGIALFGPVVIPSTASSDARESPSWDSASDSDSESESESDGGARADLLAALHCTRHSAFSTCRLTLLDRAAGSGSIAVLQWLVGEGYTFTACTMPYAAYHGRLAALQWLQQQGCPHSMGDVCAAALESTAATPRLMQWIRSCGGGDWSPDGLTEMLRKAMLYHGSSAVAEWLRGQGAAWPMDLFGMFWRNAPLRPSAGMMAWAAAHGCSWGQWGTFECTLLTESSPTARPLLHELGCPCRCPRE
eukprot:TRINITY_DN635_c0_g3_i1.p1 TRINITY_DN635_c0_g3~~TRINITY_DN635_c0_g3_i1.p1  ORF type:complete len:433 (-),score=97.18 TRINITY_DN635_c0_g3_i1:57-1355(-)